MKAFNIILFAVILFILNSCKTNPPTDPNQFSFKTGEIIVRITFEEDQTLTSDRTVLLEDFANVSCVPCVTSNKIIRRYTHDVYGPGKLVAVKFPTNFPSPNDPFYNANRASNDYRMGYYNIFFAPTTIIDGTDRPSSTDSIAIKQAIDNQISSSTDFKIQIDRQVGNNSVGYDVTVTAKNLSSYNLDEIYLRFAILETEIEFADPPGSNGEKKFYDVMRVMLPSDLGYKMSEVRTYTQQITFNYENRVDTSWNTNLLHAVAYIQNQNTMEVYQAGSSL